MRNQQLPLLPFLVCLAILGPRPASAVDGVVEINQARATAGGVTPGDAAGFPVSITTPGSYRLTGDLLVGEDLDGLQIDADDVTLDLGGFAIVGAGAATGVAAAGDNLRIHDGTLRDFQDGVIVDGDLGTVERVRVLDCSIDGITLGTGEGLHYAVYDSVATGTLGIGFYPDGGLLIGNVAAQNDTAGFLSGFLGTGTTLAIGNAALENAAGFVSESRRDLLLGNTLDRNVGAGIRTDSNDTVLYYGQNQIGLAAGSPAPPTVETTAGSAVQLGTNVCAGDTTCP